MIPLQKLEKLREGPYEVRKMGDAVEIVFVTPTLGEAASDPELGGENRVVVLRGVARGDVVELTDAYVEDSQGRRTRISLRDLELWVEYVKSL
ncbi:MAG: hypothetical protein QXP31_05385 [Pyrobaculum sp.]